MAVTIEDAAQGVKLGTPHVLFQALSVGYRMGLYDVSPDGKRFLINGDTKVLNNLPLTLVSNWTSELSH